MFSGHPPRTGGADRQRIRLDRPEHTGSAGGHARLGLRWPGRGSARPQSEGRLTPASTKGAKVAISPTVLPRRWSRARRKGPSVGRAVPFRTLPVRIKLRPRSTRYPEIGNEVGPEYRHALDPDGVSRA